MQRAVVLYKLIDLSAVDKSAFGFDSNSDRAVHKLLARRVAISAADAVATGASSDRVCARCMVATGVTLLADRHPTITAHCIKLASLPLMWSVEDINRAGLACSDSDETECEDVAARAAAIVPARDGVVALCERVLSISLPDDAAEKRWSLVGMVAAFGVMCDVAQVCFTYVCSSRGGTHACCPCSCAAAA